MRYKFSSTNNNNNGSGRKLWEAMDILMALMVVKVVKMYIYPPIHGVCIY